MNRAVHPKDLTTALGIDIKRLSILLQTFSCTLVGGCGVLYGFIYKSFHLDYFTFHVVGILLTILFVGGYSAVWGTVLAAPVLYGVPLLFPAEVASWRIAIYGACLSSCWCSSPRASSPPGSSTAWNANCRAGNRTAPNATK